MIRPTKNQGYGMSYSMHKMEERMYKKGYKVIHLHDEKVDTWNRYAKELDLVGLPITKEEFKKWINKIKIKKI